MRGLTLTSWLAESSHSGQLQPSSRQLEQKVWPQGTHVAGSFMTAMHCMHVRHASIASSARITF